MKQLHKVYIGVGTNLGDKYQNIYNAYKHIQTKIGNITSKSSIYVSEPWGFESTEIFLNSVIEIYTDLSPTDLLNKLKKIEIEVGRKKKKSNQYESRIIDLDIILYNNLVMKTEELTIPHPFFEQRDFVYIPLIEINKKIVNPKTKKQLLSQVKFTKLKKFFKKKG
jgi:2-amino-4-hydroxy-6-hydroxymethyldihydropteridine diphosphokinase